MGVRPTPIRKDEMNDCILDLCKHCDHFIDVNETYDADGNPISGQDRKSYSDTQDRKSYALAEYVHLCDAENHDPDDHHEAEPRGTPKPLSQWHADRPDLFTEHEDGTGPNSRSHKTLLPKPPEWEGK